MAQRTGSVPRAPWVAGLAAGLALALTGCTAGVAPSPGAGPGPSDAASAAPAPAQPLSGDKKAAGQVLPASVGSYRLARKQAQGGASTGFYADGATEVVVMLTPIVLTREALQTALTGPADVGDAICGTLAGSSMIACYLPLDGGNLRVTGQQGAAELAAFAGQVYAALK